jgi:hypothetical protein
MKENASGSLPTQRTMHNNLLGMLDSYKNSDYKQLIDDLQENFPSTQEEKVYTLDKLIAFACKKHRINSRVNTIAII